MSHLEPHCDVAVATRRVIPDSPGPLVAEPGRGGASMAANGCLWDRSLAVRLTGLRRQAVLACRPSGRAVAEFNPPADIAPPAQAAVTLGTGRPASCSPAFRSEESRAGKEGDGTCRARSAPYT